MEVEVLIDVMGWIGSFEVVLAYALITGDKVSVQHKGYQWLNLTGSLLLIVNTLYYGAYPSSFINIVWLIIAFVALFKARLK